MFFRRLVNETVKQGNRFFSSKTGSGVAYGACGGALGAAIGAAEFRYHGQSLPLDQELLIIAGVTAGTATMLGAMGLAATYPVQTSVAVGLFSLGYAGSKYYKGMSQALDEQKYIISKPG